MNALLNNHSKKAVPCVLSLGDYEVGKFTDCIVWNTEILSMCIATKIHHPVSVLLLVISWIFCLQFEHFSIENTSYKLYTYLRHIYPSMRYNIFKNEQTALRYK